MDKDIEATFSKEAEYDEQIKPILDQLRDKAMELNLGILVHCTFERSLEDKGSQVAETGRDAALSCNTMQLGSKLMYLSAWHQLVEHHGIPTDPQQAATMHEVATRAVTQTVTEIVEGRASY